MFILSGPVEGVKSKSTSADVVNTHFLRVINQEKNDFVERKNELQKCFGNDFESKFSEEDLHVLKEFNEKTVFADGRYFVSLPFKENCEPLGDNYQTAKRRLKNLFDRLF